MLQNLPVKDVNNVHLVCRNLHQIANLHVNPIVRLNRKSPQDLESLIKSSRIFQELQFLEPLGAENIENSTVCNACFLNPEKFYEIEKFISYTGPHIKKLTIILVILDPEFFQLLLNFLPNLEALDLNCIQINNPIEEPIKWALKSSKIKQIRMNNNPAEIVGLLESLEKCVIEEAELGNSLPKELEMVEKFLRSQEKSLKKLTINSFWNVPNNLKDLRLEFLNIRYKYCKADTSLEFLKSQIDLKVLKIDGCQFSGEDLSMICELKQLEILKLYGRARDSSGLSKLYQLEKLKRLEIGWDVCPNILDHLKLGTFEDLEELYAWFEDASVESIQEMKRWTPNLKEIEIQNACSDTINALLESLEHLEKVKFWSSHLELSSEKVYPKMKHLDVDANRYVSVYRAAQVSQQFPNLEFLKFDRVSFEPTESFFVTLLSGLKRLKTLELDIQTDTKIESDFVLPCFEKYGSHLEEVQVRAVQDPNLMKDRSGVIEFTIDKKLDGFCFDKVFDDRGPEYDLEQPWATCCPLSCLLWPFKCL